MLKLSALTILLLLFLVKCSASSDPLLDMILKTEKYSAEQPEKPTATREFSIYLETPPVIQKIPEPATNYAILGTGIAAIAFLPKRMKA